MSTEQLGETIRALKDLVASPGWKYYATIVEQQVAVRVAKLLQPLQTHDETLEQEYLKGEIAQLKLSAFLPQTMLEDLERERELLRAENPDPTGDA